MQSEIALLPGVVLRQPSLVEVSALRCSALAGVLPFATFRFASLGDCPASFCVAFPAQGKDNPAWQTGWGVAGGRAMEPVAALMGCAGELAERLSLISRGSDDPLVSPDGPPTLSANDVLKFSGKQEAALAMRHARLRGALTPAGIDWPMISHRSVDLTAIATGRRETASSLCLLLREESWFGIMGEQIGSSAGAAAHPVPDQARLRALLELAERDAVGIWWFNRLTASTIDPDRIANADQSLWHWLTDRERQVRLLLLPTDLPVHVVAAVSATPAGAWVAYGFCARLDLEDAILGAALEMLQCELSLSAMARRFRDAHDVSEDWPPLLRWSARSCLDTVVGRSETTPLSVAATAPIGGDDFEAAMGRRATYLADITRDEIDIPVVRAVSTRLRDWEPRFGAGRLYTLPLELGLATVARCEQNLNEDRIVV